MSSPKAFLAALLVLVTVCVAAPPASAHATLEATEPGDGARLDAAPDEVTLDFTEPVSAPTGAVSVVDGSGDAVDSGEVSTDGGTVSARLSADVDDGAYIVTYRVVSADGHPIQGAFSFAVGAADPADASAVSSASGADEDRAAEVAAGVARWFAYLAALLAAGGALYRVAVEREVTGDWSHARLVRTAAMAGIAGVLVGLLLQAHLATGLGAGALATDGVASVVLGDGVFASAAVTIAGLVIILLALRSDLRRRSGALLLLGAAGTVTGFALTGHTNTGEPRWLGVGADVVHLGAGAAWLGGLVLLARAVRAIGRAGGPVRASTLVARFSAVASIAILAVGASGSALGWTQVRTLSGLTGTTYGQLLLVKVAIVALIAAVAGYNRFFLVPAVTAATAGRPGEAGWRVLGRTVRLEVGAIVVAVAVTAALVNVTPARAEVTGPATDTAPLGDGSVDVVVDPPQAGRTEVSVHLLDATGHPADLAHHGMTLELSLPARALGPIVRQPDPVGLGQYQLDGTDLSVPGRWRIDVVARVSRFEQLRATTEVTIRP